MQFTRLRQAAAVRDWGVDAGDKSGKEEKTTRAAYQRDAKSVFAGSVTSMSQAIAAPSRSRYCAVDCPRAYRLLS
jgi:hypothetical protein